MHAVLLTTTIDPDRASEAQSLLATDVVPRVKVAPGLVAAYWLRSDNRRHGTSVIILESEEAARAVADIAQSMPGGELVHLDSVEVREVVAQVRETGSPRPTGGAGSSRASLLRDHE